MIVCQLSCVALGGLFSIKLCDTGLFLHKISNAYNVYCRKIVNALREEFIVVEEQIMRFYDTVIAPRLPTLNAEQMRAELVARLGRVEDRIINFKSTMSEKWTGNDIYCYFHST